MGFGKSQPPSPGQTDSEPDTSNVSNDANQAKSPPVPNRKFQEKWISLYPWLVYDAENNLMKCSVCLNAKKTNKWPICFRHIRTQLTYWISAFQDKRPEEFIWVRSFDLSIIKSSWNPEYVNGAKVKVNDFENILLNTEIRYIPDSWNIKNALCFVKFVSRLLYIENGNRFMLSTKNK
jgi:hypothetical protein